MILAANRGRCPRTAAAARHAIERRPSFNTHLPVWLARWNETIFGTILVGGLWLTAIFWLQSTRA